MKKEPTYSIDEIMKLTQEIYYTDKDALGVLANLIIEESSLYSSIDLENITLYYKALEKTNAQHSKRY